MIWSKSSGSQKNWRAVVPFVIYPIIGSRYGGKGSIDSQEWISFSRSAFIARISSHIDADAETSLPKDPSSVKDFAEILRNDTFITIGEDEKGNAKAKKERIRLMTFVVGVDYPFITKMDEPTTGNRTLDFPKTKREELLKSLQSDLGAEVMQYVGKIIVLMK
jgi:hypothetical protein